MDDVTSVQFVEVLFFIILYVHHGTKRSLRKQTILLSVAQKTEVSWNEHQL